MKDIEMIRRVLDHAKPDERMMLEAIKEANSTIKFLMHQCKVAEERWTEMFVMLATVLNKFDKEIRVEHIHMISLSPHDYDITIEEDLETKDKIIRLRYKLPRD